MKVHTDLASVWEYLQQPPKNVRLLLLTKDNRTEVGPWKGEPLGSNRTYKAWCGLPARDDEIEIELGYL